MIVTTPAQEIHLLRRVHSLLLVQLPRRGLVVWGNPACRPHAETRWAARQGEAGAAHAERDRPLAELEAAHTDSAQKKLRTL